MIRVVFSITSRCTRCDAADDDAAPTAASRHEVVITLRLRAILRALLTGKAIRL